MSIPSNLHRTPIGEFPLTTISFLESSAPPTPAKLEAILAGSPLVPAYFSVSSTENARELIIAISFIASPLSSVAVISSSFMLTKDSSIVRSKITSLPEPTITLGIIMVW